MQIFYCNSCLKQLHMLGTDEPPPNCSKNYLTQCKHILCHECVRKSHPNCAVCRQSTEFMKIDKNTSIKFRMLFEPLENTFKRVCTSIKFQEHQLDFIYKEMCKKYSKLMETGRSMKQKCDQMKEQHAKIEKNIQKMQFILKKVAESKYVW